MRDASSSSEPYYIYWHPSVISAWAADSSNISLRRHLGALRRQSLSGVVHLVTLATSETEVLETATETGCAPEPVTAILQDLLDGSHPPVVTINLDRSMCHHARELLMQAQREGIQVSISDCRHVAAASWIGAAVLHSITPGLDRLAAFLRKPFSVEQPTSSDPLLHEDVIKNARPVPHGSSDPLERFAAKAKKQRRRAPRKATRA